MSPDGQFRVNLWDLWTLNFSHHCANFKYVWFFTWAYITIFSPMLSNILTVSFLVLGLGHFFSTITTITNQVHQFNEYSTLSITTVSLPLPAGRITILLLTHSHLMTSLSDFEIFALGVFAFSCACLNFHLSLSAWVLGIFKATSSLSAITSK